MEYVPQIDGHPEYETTKDGKLNDEHCFVYIFKAPKRHINNAANKQENISNREKTLTFYQPKCHVYVLLLHFMAFFLKQVIWAEFRCPQAIALTALRPFLTERMFVCRTYFRQFDKL